jgi:hypothetical protein
LYEMLVSDIERLLLINKANLNGGESEINLYVYHTQDAKLQNLLDFDPEAISDCIDLGYVLADNPKTNDELAVTCNLGIDQRQYKCIG